MRNYAQGGLALATGGTTGSDPDERDDPSIVGAGGLEEVVGELEREPANLPTQSSSKSGKAMTNQDAMKRLEDARQRLVDRRDSIEENKRGDWLAMAQGLLAPTRTGRFGESIGVAAGNVREARTDRRKELTQIENDLLDAEVKQQTLNQQSRARLGSSSTVYHPDDVVAYPNDKSKWRQIEKQTIVHNDGTTEHVFTGTDSGELLQVASRNNPITVSEAEKAKEAAGAAEKLRSHEIETGLNSTLAVGKLQRAREIFDGVSSTSGIKGKFVDLAQFLGIDIDEGADFQLARRLMGAEVLNQLTLLTGTKTDFEYKKIEELNASTAKSKEANLAIIDDMLGRYENMIKFGEEAALERAEDADTDLSVMRFRNYRSEQAAKEEMKAMQEKAPGGRPPDPRADARLIEMFDPKNPNNDQLIEYYKNNYGWPPSDPNVVSELRAKGYDG